MPELSESVAGHFLRNAPAGEFEAVHDLVVQIFPDVPKDSIFTAALEHHKRIGTVIQLGQGEAPVCT